MKTIAITLSAEQVTTICEDLAVCVESYLPPEALEPDSEYAAVVAAWRDHAPSFLALSAFEGMDPDEAQEICADYDKKTDLLEYLSAHLSA